MTYIEYLNDFNRWIETDIPTDKTIILYYGLLGTFNHRRWPRWTGVDMARLLGKLCREDKSLRLCGITGGTKDIVSTILNCVFFWKFYQKVLPAEEFPSVEETI